MKKEIKNFGKILEVILIILTFVSLVIDLLIITNTIYIYRYDTMSLNSVVISMPFNVVLWINNILIYFISIFYIIDTIKEKKNVLLKLSFCLFSILTTIVVFSLIMNFVAELFNIF